MRARLNCVCSLYHLRANMAENNDLRLSPLAEALRCLGLGLRGSLLLRAAAYSLGVWLLSVLLWVVVFFFAWDAVAPHLAPAAWPLWLQMLWRFLAGAVLFVALVFVTMRLLLDFFLIEIINREVEKSYALAPRCTPPPRYCPGRCCTSRMPSSCRSTACCAPMSARTRSATTSRRRSAS